jgi:hypothetical protein
MKSILIDLADKTSDNNISRKLDEIAGDNQSEINLEIKNAPDRKTKNMMLNVNLFSKIKEIQDLPDWVIIKLLLAEGKLKSSDFKKRLLNG